MNPPPVCAACGHSLPETFPASTPAICPACDLALAGGARTARSRNTLSVAVVLLLPVLISLLFRKSEVTIFTTLFVAPLLALSGGILMGLRLGRTPLTQAGWCVGLTIVLLVCSEALLSFGCAADKIDIPLVRRPLI